MTTQHHPTHPSPGTAIDLPTKTHANKQRYTGVKIKYRPPLTGAALEAADTQAAAAAAAEGGGGGEEGQGAGQNAVRKVSSREVFIGIFPSGKAVITGAITWQEVDLVRSPPSFPPVQRCELDSHINKPQTLTPEP